MKNATKLTLALCAAVLVISSAFGMEKSRTISPVEAALAQLVVESREKFDQLLAHLASLQKNAIATFAQEKMKIIEKRIEQRSKVKEQLPQAKL